MADIPSQETDYETEEYKQEGDKQEDNTDQTQQRPDDLLNNDLNKSYENTTFDPPGLDPPECKWESRGKETKPGSLETEENLELSRTFEKYGTNINEQDLKFGIKKSNAPNLFQKKEPGSRNQYRLLFFDYVPIRRFKIDGGTDMVEIKSSIRPKSTTYKMKDIVPKQEEFNKL